MAMIRIRKVSFLNLSGKRRICLRYSKNKETFKLNGYSHLDIKEKGVLRNWNGLEEGKIE